MQEEPEANEKDEKQANEMIKQAEEEKERKVRIFNFGNQSRINFADAQHF